MPALCWSSFYKAFEASITAYLYCGDLLRLLLLTKKSLQERSFLLFLLSVVYNNLFSPEKYLNRTFKELCYIIRNYLYSSLLPLWRTMTQRIYRCSKNYSFRLVVYFSSTKIEAGKFFTSDSDSPNNSASGTRFVKFLPVKSTKTEPKY